MVFIPLHIHTYMDPRVSTEGMGNGVEGGGLKWVVEVKVGRAIRY